MEESNGGRLPARSGAMNAETLAHVRIGCGVELLGIDCITLDDANARLAGQYAQPLRTPQEQGQIDICAFEKELGRDTGNLPVRANDENVRHGSREIS